MSYSNTTCTLNVCMCVVGDSLTNYLDLLHLSVQHNVLHLQVPAADSEILSESSKETLSE